MLHNQIKMILYAQSLLPHTSQFRILYQTGIAPDLQKKKTKSEICQQPKKGKHLAVKFCFLQPTTLPFFRGHVEDGVFKQNPGIA